MRESDTSVDSDQSDVQNNVPAMFSAVALKSTELWVAARQERAAKSAVAKP